MAKKNPIIVLTTRGKGWNVDFAQISLFTSVEKAEKYCKDVNVGGHRKYWKMAEIVNENEAVELLPPEYDNQDD